MKLIQAILSLIIMGMITSCTSASTSMKQTGNGETIHIEEEQIIIEQGWYKYPFHFPGIKMDDIFIKNRLVRKLPVYYPDAAFMTAAFPLPMKKAREFIGIEELNPVEIEPGYACIAFTALEFRKVDRIRGYNEVPISIPVLFKNKEETQGAYTLYKPITSFRGLWAGVIYWRAPKVMAQINFVDTDDTRNCIVKIDGKDLITVKFKKIPMNQRNYDAYWYSIKDAKILRNLLAIKGQVGITKQRNSASFRLGNHPIAHQLKTLKISESSLFHAYAPKVTILLHKAGFGGIFPFEKKGGGQE